MKSTRHSNPEQQNEASRDPKIPPEIRHALQRILNYLWADEEDDYRAMPPGESRSEHIFVEIQKIDRWLNVPPDGDFHPAVCTPPQAHERRNPCAAPTLEIASLRGWTPEPRE